MKKSAYYSRNNSFSRSFNAECAEEEGRFPLTRAAKVIGLSLNHFKEALKLANIKTNEWHHVGKFANRVDYYDTIEIKNNVNFWLAALKLSKTTKQKELIRQNLKSLVLSNLLEKLANKEIQIVKTPSFKNKLNEICSEKGSLLKEIANHFDERYFKSDSLKKTVHISYGSYIDDADGCLTSLGRHIKPFDLSPKNIKAVTREISLKKFNRLNRDSVSPVERLKLRNYKVLRILDRRIRGKVHGNSLVDCSALDFEKAARIVEKLYSDEFFVERTETGIFIKRKEIKNVA
ncbi:MAG: hypothetical protein HS119_11445 [Flavobacteriales bacterium]|nr:hypothetical protein [Flavobacteriales bacterium]